MLANIMIRDYHVDDVIVVPTKYIKQEKGHDIAYIVEGDKARKKQIELGESYNGESVVLKGLEPDQQMITKGYMEITDDENVEVVN
ncbi:MAG: hypothetical protein IH946_09380 [Bacteroidetes bacterium]|nr:hypothetical protein [Bacteroidota bacterium]